jgi:hypothetical protein
MAEHWKEFWGKGYIAERIETLSVENVIIDVIPLVANLEGFSQPRNEAGVLVRYKKKGE